MSLINRMLSDLAARQAPGADAMSGVQLSGPLVTESNLSRRTGFWLVLLLITAAILAWLFWPRIHIPEPPQLRMAPSLTDTQNLGNRDTVAGTAAMPTAKPQRALLAAEKTMPAPPGLRLTGSLQLPENLSATTLRTEQQPHAKPAPSKPVQAPQPDRTRETRGATQQQQSSTRRQTSSERTTISEPRRQDSGSTPFKTQEDPVSRARAWLAADNALAALESLGAPTNSETTESLALRAAALQRLRRHEQAAALYGRLTQAEPTQPAHWIGLAISLEGSAKPDAALMAYSRGLSSEHLAPSLRAFAQKRLAELNSR